MSVSIHFGAKVSTRCCRVRVSVCVHLGCRCQGQCAKVPDMLEPGCCSVRVPAVMAYTCLGAMVPGCRGARVSRCQLARVLWFHCAYILEGVAVSRCHGATWIAAEHLVYLGSMLACFSPCGQAFCEPGQPAGPADMVKPGCAAKSRYELSGYPGEVMSFKAYSFRLKNLGV